jgi:hypothetical protein
MKVGFLPYQVVGELVLIPLLVPVALVGLERVVIMPIFGLLQKI